MAECYLGEGKFENAIKFLQDVINTVEAKIKLCAESKRLDPIKERLDIFLRRLYLDLASTKYL